MKEKLTTAKLRDLAYEAYHKAKFKLALKYYKQALKNYPKSLNYGQLTGDDKEELRKKIESLETTIRIEKTMTYLKEDYWGRKVFLDEHGRTWKKVDGIFHSITEEGEPDCPIKKSIKVKEVI